MNHNQPLPEHIQELVQRGAIFFVSHSAGKDSQAMFNYLYDKIPHEQLHVIHADLGEDVEWDGVVEHIQNTIGDLPLSVVKAGKTFFDMVRHRGMFPSPKYRQCTSDLKTGPIYKEIRRVAKERGVDLVVNCIGIRAQESGPRSRQTPFKINKKLTTQSREAYDWMPIFKMLEDEVFNTIAANGQEPHWAYQAGMTRLSCCFCIMASKKDLATSMKHNPEKLEKIAALEKEVGHTMFFVKGEQGDIKTYIAS